MITFIISYFPFWISWKSWDKIQTVDSPNPTFFATYFGQDIHFWGGWQSFRDVVFWWWIWLEPREKTQAFKLWKCTTLEMFDKSMGKMLVPLGWGPLNNQPHIHLKNSGKFIGAHIPLLKGSNRGVKQHMGPWDRMPSGKKHIAGWKIHNLKMHFL